MKKFTAIFVALMVAISMFVGVSAGAAPKKPAAKPAKKATKPVKKPAAKTINVKVGLSTDEGGLNDKSFNQAANDGALKAKKEFGLTFYKAIESKSNDMYEPNLQSLIDAGCGLVFAVGYQMDAAVNHIAKANPKTKIVIIDDVVPFSNVESITFKAQESSFLVGVIAGKMTKTGKIGFIGGKDGALIQAFEYGFYAGVKSVNPTAAADLLSRKNTKYVESFVDATKGNDAATELYQAGCDIIYHAAGGVGLGLFQAAKDLRAKGQDVWAIGVDQDQAVTAPDFKDVILSSAFKKVDIGTYSAIKDTVNGQFKGGKTITLGLKEGGVGIAPSTKDHVSKDVLDLVAKYQKAIIDGKIVVPYDKKTAEAFQPVAVK